MKNLDERRKAISLAISRAYGQTLHPVDIPTDHAADDVRLFISKTAGKPHADLTIAKVAALAVSRAGAVSGDEALASVLADLIDGGVSLDRVAAAHRGLGDLMARHRATRARKNPLPADLKAKARESAPTVVRRGGGSALRQSAPPPPVASRAAAGSVVRYKRLDDESDHVIALGSAPAGSTVRAAPMSSPVARALLGSTKGTIVTLAIAGTQFEVEVLEVK